MSYTAKSLERGLTLDAGTSVLVSGETDAVRDRMLDAVAEGLDRGEAVILIAADATAETVLDELRDRDALVPERLGVVDVTGEDGPGEVSGVAVAQVGSPADLTGMSLEFAKLVDGFAGDHAPDRVRVALVSVSTLLMYAELQTVFRFLHVFSSRIQSAGLFGLFALYPGMHDDTETNTVRAIFDCEAAVSGDGVEIHGPGYLSA